MSEIENLMVPPPGTYIREELEARNWTQRDLAFVLGVPEQAVNMIVAGKRGISPEMAKTLGEAFDVPAEFFMNLQREYELSRARKPDPSVSRRAKLQEHYPVREMIRRGWLEDVDAQMLEIHLARFFEVPSCDDVPHLRHAAKKTHYDEVPPSQIAWLFRVRQIARSVQVTSYSEKHLREATGELARLLLAPEEIRNVPRILAECGVRFVVVEALPGSKIDGVCLWLDAASPVIGMSVQRDRIDNFWFVLRHEIEHVLRGDGKTIECMDLDIDPVSDQDTDALPSVEQIANAEAAEFCVPQRALDDFIARIQPYFSEQRIQLFAQKLNLHPGLVVGQIQRRLKRYDFLKKHQVRVRQFVFPAAFADGWGQSFPVNL